VVCCERRVVSGLCVVLCALECAVWLLRACSALCSVGLRAALLCVTVGLRAAQQHELTKDQTVTIAY